MINQLYWLRLLPINFSAVFLPSLFFLFFFLTQLSVRGVVYTERVVDIQVILRLAVYLFCTFYFLSCVKYFFLEIFHKQRMLLFLFIFFFIGAAFSASSYGMYSLLTNFMCLFIVYSFIIRVGISKILSWYVYSVFFVACIGFYFYIYFPDIGRYSFWVDYIFLMSDRMQGVSGHPNTLGFMICGALLIIAFGLKFNFLLFLISIFLFYILLLTNNRTSIFCFVYILFFLKSLQYKVGLQFHLILVGLFFLLFAAYFLTPGFLFLQLGFLTRSGDLFELFTLTGRFDIWYSIFTLNFFQILFGVGYGEVSNHLINSSDLIGFSVGQAHNLYLQLLLASGLFGLLLFLLFIVKSLLNSVSNRWCLSIFLSVIIFGFLETVIFNTVANSAFVYFSLAVFARVGSTFDT